MTAPHPSINKAANILVISAKGHLLMQQAPSDPDTGAPGLVSAFGGVIQPGESAIKAAVRVLRESTGLEVHTDDLEFLDTYYPTAATDGQDGEAHTFILAGVNEDRVYVYGGGELCTVRRSDDFSAINLSSLTRKQATDYIKRHKK